MLILTKSNSTSYKKFWSIAIILLITSALVLLGFILYHTPDNFYIVALLWIITVVTLLWIGNRIIHNILNKKFSWIEQTSRRLFLQAVFNTIYSLFCINITYYLFKLQTTKMVPESEQILVLNVYGLLFIIPVLSINFGFFFMMQWKKSHIESNKLMEENLRTQLDSLRMHLDPHFLFNNLNILSTLIQKDPRGAQIFLDKFADVYRYVLEYKREELVKLATELEFIEAYSFLMNMRFRNQLKISIAIPADVANTTYIPPLALQMLLENAIKHNKISKINPLLISVFTDGKGTLVVRNTYQPKKEITNAPLKTGLENIRKRYRYLSELNIEVIQDDDYFTVSLPLLEMSK